MTAGVLENLGELAEAPGGVDRLRSLIMALAISGRLVPQDQADEPVSKLCALLTGHWRIRSARRTTLAEVAEADQRHQLPSSWKWMRFGFVAETRLGKMLDAAKNAGDLKPYLRNTNVQWGTFDLADLKELRLSPSELDEYAVRAGDLLICEGGEPGRCAVWRDESREIYFQKALHRVRPLFGISADYLKLCLQIDAKTRVLDRLFTGATIKHLTGEKLERHVIPVPPQQEQHRIVSKVDELMALCDRLEARQQDAEAAHARLVQALLDSLTQARDADQFQACWQRVAGQFPVLFTTDASIDALASTVLELAVSGRLALSSSEEVPAVQLLREVASVKAKLVDAEGLRTTARDNIPPEEHYLPLPRGWSYARIGNLARFIDYRGRTPNKTTAGAPLITAKNVRPGYISREPREFIAEEEFSAWMTRGFPRVGDMLFTTEAPLGNVALIDIEERFALAQRVICFQLHRPDMGPYLRVAFMSRSVQKQILNMATGMTATGVKASRLKELPLPIPPLGEQHSIVAKVTELLALCDQLKARLTAARAKHAQLAEALVAQAVAA